MPDSSQSTDAAGFLHPETVLNQIKIDKGMTIADFGCGTGHFTILLAKRVGGESGNEGKVYAVDVLEQPLESVRSMAKSESILNIETLRANLEDIGSVNIPDGSCDMVLIANILFQSEKKEDIFKEAFRVLKDGGKIVLIDWIPDKALFRGMGNFIMSPEEAQKIAADTGFSLERKIDVGTHHFGFIFVK